MTATMMKADEPKQMNRKAFDAQRAELSKQLEARQDEMKQERIKLIRDYATQVAVPTFEQMSAHGLTEAELESAKARLLKRIDAQRLLREGNQGMMTMGSIYAEIEMEDRAEAGRRSAWDQAQHSRLHQYITARQALASSADASNVLQDTCSQDLKDEWNLTCKQIETAERKRIDFEIQLKMKKRALRDKEEYLEDVKRQGGAAGRNLKQHVAEVEAIKTEVDRIATDATEMEKQLVTYLADEKALAKKLGEIQTQMMIPENI